VAVFNLISGLLLAAIAAGAAQPPGATRVVGRVVDAKTEEPLVGATIILRPAVPGGGPLPFGPFEAQTDDRGAFSLDVPSSYRYLVDVNQPGFVASNISTNRSISGRTANLGNIRITRGGAIEGRVLDANGTPMPGVGVSVVPPGLNLRSRNEVGRRVGSIAQTNDLGAFRVSGVPAGKYYVVAQPAVRVPFNRQPVTDATFVSTYYPGTTRPGAARLVTVSAGNTTNGIEFRLTETTTVTVSGIVVANREGWPVDAAMVSFRSENDRLGRPVSAISLPDGSFTVELPDGNYRVEASRQVVVSQTATSRSVRYVPGSKSVKVKVAGRPVSGLKVLADR